MKCSIFSFYNFLFYLNSVTIGFADYTKLIIHRKMKRKSLILLSFMFLISTLNSINGQNTNDLEKSDLKGKVKSVKSTYLSRGEWQSQEYAIFNKKGYEVENSTFFEKDTLHSMTKTKYKNNKVVEKITKFPSENNRLKKRIYSYDKNDNVIEEIAYENNKIDSKIIYEYSKTNNLINEIQFDENNDKKSEFKYVYDERGNQIEKYRTKYGKRYKSVFEYNASNDIVKQQLFNPKNELEQESHYTYDLNHNLILQKNYYGVRRSGKLKNKVTYKYNDQNLKTEIITLGPDDLPTEKIIYEYDKFGERTLWNRLDGNSNIISNNRYENTYDEKNNLIKTVQFSDGTISRVTLYEIRYFE